MKALCRKHFTNTFKLRETGVHGRAEVTNEMSCKEIGELFFLDGGGVQSFTVEKKQMQRNRYAKRFRELPEI